MKKLLSLLSVLTISGTAVPTTIAASPYQKEEKLKNEINYSQINYLKKINRVKRNNNNDSEIYWLNSVTNFKKQNDVPYPVTTMYTFTKDGGNRKAGDIYFGTTNGIYLRKAGELTTTKIDGIDGPILFIKPYSDNNNSIHIIKLKLLNKNISTKFKLQRRNNNNNINLNVPVISQCTPYWCGPAVGEAVLRYFGFNFNGEDSFSAQTTLSNYMGTQTQSGQIIGTYADNWTNTINNYINEQNLNNRRLYTASRIPYFDYYTANRFYNAVSFSLENNTPVAFIYHGSNNVNQENHSHFILITGVTNSPTNPIYTYMDPWTGQYSTFNSSNLVTYLTRNIRDLDMGYEGGYLISYTGGNNNWDYVQMDTGFDWSSCIIPELSLTNITQAAASTAAGSAIGTEFPVVGNIIGGFIGLISWYKIKLDNCIKK